MAAAPKESNVHHYVPQAMLRRFAADDARTFVYVFDKTSGRTWPGGIRSTGAQKGYNTLLQPNGARLNFESDFDEIDADYARIGEELAAHRSLAGTTNAFRARLADVVAAQFLRTPLVRSTLAALPREFAARFRALGLEAPSEDELPDDDSVRQSARDLLGRRGRDRRALLAKDIVLFEPAGAARFWTSDHPVVRHTRHPLGETGLASLGVEIYLPIARDLVVGFLCPSLRAQHVIEVVGGAPRSVAVDAALVRDAPLRVGDEVVHFFNALQVTSSERLLFASSDDFDLARKLIAEDPAFARPSPLVRMGEIGAGPARSGNLPPGEWVYLEKGQGYLMIPIRDYQPGHALTMATDRSDLLAVAVALAPFDRAQVFAEAGDSLLRDAEIELIDAAPPPRFRLTFADADMKALDKLIARGDGADRP